MAVADADGDGMISLAKLLQLGGLLQEVAALKAEVLSNVHRAARPTS